MEKRERERDRERMRGSERETDEMVRAGQEGCDNLVIYTDITNPRHYKHWT